MLRTLVDILKNSNLSEAILRGSDFSNAILDSANFINTKLHNINFSGAQFHYTLLKSAIFEEANLNNSKFIGANLDNAQIIWSFLGNSWLENVSLCSTIFGETYLNNTYLVKNNTNAETKFNRVHFDSLFVSKRNWLPFIKDSLKLRVSNEFFTKYKVERDSFRNLADFEDFSYLYIISKK